MVMIQCSTAWVSHLLCFRPSLNKGSGPFPDDILINILSRLPAEAILRCRKVCRHWKALTSSSLFITLQNQRAPSVLLFQSERLSSVEKRRYYVYDALAKKLRKISFKSKFGFEGRDKKRFKTIDLQSACGPLLHYRADGYYNWRRGVHNFAFNLITRQVGALKMRWKGYVCGLFFNDARNEYNFLSTRWYANGANQFYVYSLYPPTGLEIACSNFLCASHAMTSPIVVNRALYLMMYPIEKGKNHCKHAVLVFEMDSGKFYALPHPEFECPRTVVHHLDMLLFAHDGHLCISHNDKVLGLLEIWILKDYAKWYWVPLTSTISLPITKGDDTATPHYAIHSVGKDELLVYWDASLFLVNLKEESVKEIKTPSKYHCGTTSLELVAYRSTLAAPHLVWDEKKPPLFHL